MTDASLSTGASLADALVLVHGEWLPVAGDTAATAGFDFDVWEGVASTFEFDIDPADDPWTGQFISA